MKTILIALIGISLILMNSCERDHLIRFGFDSQFNKDSRGLSIMAVNKTASAVYLYGIVELREGEIEVELINGNGVVVHTINLYDQDYLQVNKRFTAVPGFWKLKYKSKEGKGNIKLHLNY